MKVQKWIVYVALSLSLVITGVSQADTNYCAAIRGNGELILAHWPALARAVENEGYPKAVAGGSSAAITLFYLDAISQNPYLSKDPDIRKKQQALLLKSVLIHTQYLWEEDTQAPKVMTAIEDFKKFGEESFLGKVKIALKLAKDLPTFMEILGEYGPLFNPEMARGLKENFEFYKQQISEALFYLGNFDAKTDKNIFYRNALIDFKYLALLVGRIGDFYAGNYSDKQKDAGSAMRQFLKICGTASVGQVWFDEGEKGSTCSQLYKEALVSFYKKPKVRVRNPNGKGFSTRTVNREFANKLIFKAVGSGLSAFPTTAIVKGDAYNRYTEGKKIYDSGAPEQIDDFSLDYNSELSYGYWGKTEQLNFIGSNLKKNFANDLKSQKFEALYNGNWFEVLSTSPAEPGLANLQRIPDGSKMDGQTAVDKSYFEGWWLLKYFKLKAQTWYNEENPEKSIIPFRKGVFSAGGWSDLHPMLVLKSHGCENTLYVTRQNGESVFGQQIFIRLTGDTKTLPFWKEINQQNNRIGWHDLTPEMEQTPWNRLYNLANGKSSFLKSVGQADVVHCTNWDAYNLFENTKQTIKEISLDSWIAPLFKKRSIEQRGAFNYGNDQTDTVGDGFPGCLSTPPTVKRNSVLVN